MKLLDVSNILWGGIMKKVNVPKITTTNFDNIWKQYEILVELYKFYFTLILSGCTFINGIIGVLTIYSIRNSVPQVIGFTILIAVSFAVFLFFALPMVEELKASLENIVQKLGVGLVPHTKLLIYALKISFVMYCIITLLLIILLYLILNGNLLIQNDFLEISGN